MNQYINNNNNNSNSNSNNSNHNNNNSNNDNGNNIAGWNRVGISPGRATRIKRTGLSCLANFDP